MMRAGRRLLGSRIGIGLGRHDLYMMGLVDKGDGFQSDGIMVIVVVY